MIAGYSADGESSYTLIGPKFYTRGFLFPGLKHMDLRYITVQETE
jgi:hypothetical protein